MFVVSACIIIALIRPILEYCCPVWDPGSYDNAGDHWSGPSSDVKLGHFVQSMSGQVGLAYRNSFKCTLRVEKRGQPNSCWRVWVVVTCYIGQNKDSEIVRLLLVPYSILLL